MDKWWFRCVLTINICSLRPTSHFCHKNISDQMETFSASLAICAGNSPVTGEFPAQRPVTRSFDVSLICDWINGWVNSREAGDLRHHRAQYDVIMMTNKSAAWRFYICFSQEALYTAKDNVIWEMILMLMNSKMWVIFRCIATGGNHTRYPENIPGTMTRSTRSSNIR